MVVKKILSAICLLVFAFLKLLVLPPLCGVLVRPLTLPPRPTSRIHLLRF